MRDRPHYVLRIEIVDPPEGYEARLEVGKDSLPNLMVEYDLRFAGERGWLPVGPTVRAEKDGRRFVYVAWWRDGVRTGRLKVPLAGVDHFAEEPLVRVQGRNLKGRPACAWAKII